MATYWDSVYKYETIDMWSSIPEIELGTKSNACGWLCKGCHATNGPDENRCPWCRSYRLERERQDDSLQTQMATQQALLDALESTKWRLQAKEALRKNDPSLYIPRIRQETPKK